MPSSESVPRAAPLPTSAWLRCKPASVLAGRGDREFYTFDLSGRLLEAYVGSVAYRRGLDGRVLARRTDRRLEGLSRRRRRMLGPRAARRLVERAYQTAVQALAALPAAGGRAAGGVDAPGAKDFWPLSPEELEADAARFRRIWEPIGILPPDQYLSVVLQLTAGCWYNRCTFCTFYRQRPFRVRSPEEFRRHVGEVVAFFGPGIARRHSIFLGDANALVLPVRRLIPYFETVAALFSFEGCESAHAGRGVEGRPHGERGSEGAGRPGPMDGIYAFLDAFSGRKKAVTEWKELADRHLRRVYVGLESGSDRLLAFLEKPGSAADAVAMVDALRRAGVGVGVILMVGAGGAAFAEEHVRESVRCVNAMGLGAGDQLLLSPFVEQPGAPYSQKARRAGVRPLAPAELCQQAEALLEGIRLGRGARWSYYFVEEFLY